MNYLHHTECNDNGWPLYWTRTIRDWKTCGKSMQDAHTHFHSLLRDYRLAIKLIGSNPSDDDSAYDHWFNAGKNRRCRGYLETMSSNTYPGNTWIGLYAYMDGMEAASKLTETERIDAEED